MNKTYLIFKHEFFHTIKKVGWIIMTFIVPVLALSAIGIYALVKNISEPAKIVVRSVGYVDNTASFNDFKSQYQINLIEFGSEEKVLEAITKREVSEYFVIPEDYFSDGKVQRFTLEKELATPPLVSYAIKRFLSQNLLKDKVSPEITSLIVSPLNMQVTRITEKGGVSDEQSNVGYLIIAGIFSLLLGLSLLVGATTLISGLGEEKESRLIEVLFSSVSIRLLLVGKVMALGLAGLLQVLIWLASVPVIINLASSTFGGIMSSLQIPVDFIILGIVFFILGYLLFSVLSIAVGAISSNAQEGSQLSMFYTMASFIPLWFLSLLVMYPQSPVWTVLTIFPVTAPVQVMMRMGVTDIPTWQIITSIAVLILSIIAGLNFSIRIFRRNMLKHGEKTGLKALIAGFKSS